jgi:hypothetical protein
VWSPGPTERRKYIKATTRKTVRREDEIDASFEDSRDARDSRYDSHRRDIEIGSLGRPLVEDVVHIVAFHDCMNISAKPGGWQPW